MGCKAPKGLMKIELEERSIVTYRDSLSRDRLLSSDLLQSRGSLSPKPAAQHACVLVAIIKVYKMNRRFIII